MTSSPAEATLWRPSPGPPRVSWWPSPPIRTPPAAAFHTVRPLEARDGLPTTVMGPAPANTKRRAGEADDVERGVGHPIVHGDEGGFGVALTRELGLGVGGARDVVGVVARPAARLVDALAGVERVVAEHGGVAALAEEGVVAREAEHRAARDGVDRRVGEGRADDRARRHGGPEDRPGEQQRLVADARPARRLAREGRGGDAQEVLEARAGPLEHGAQTAGAEESRRRARSPRPPCRCGRRG